MQNLQIIKVGYFIVLFMMVMLLPMNGFSAAQQADSWLDEPVTVRFQHEPLSKVLEKVSQQTGIAILYDQELANEKVSGNYKDVKASDAITRLFSGKNKSIQVSKDKKVIIVKTFGAKDFILASTVEKQGKPLQMSLVELEKLHALQFKESITNDNEVIEGGMIRGELSAMHKQQYKDHQAQITNDNTILEGGITFGELRIMHERQYKESQKRINDSQILEDVNMTRGELSAMHKQQYKDHQAQITNDNTILEGGITLGELRTMHKQQYNERIAKGQ